MTEHAPIEPETLAEHRGARRVARRLKTIDLDALQVAAPCSASWDDMRGDARRRFCDACKQNVYDFSNLTRREIATLLAQDGERVCGRLYRRADGTVLTADCPVGLAERLRRRLVRSGGVLATLLLVLLGFLGLRRERRHVVMGEMRMPPGLEARERARAQAERRARLEVELRRRSAAKREEQRRAQATYEQWERSPAGRRARREAPSPEQQLDDARAAVRAREASSPRSR
jgi:hypothetical protein